LNGRPINFEEKDQKKGTSFPSLKEKVIEGYYGTIHYARSPKVALQWEECVFYFGAQRLFSLKLHIKLISEE